LFRVLCCHAEDVEGQTSFEIPLASDLSTFSETIENNTSKTSKLLVHGNNLYAKFINKINNIVFQAK
jgi:hypothetical protein